MKGRTQADREVARARVVTASRYGAIGGAPFTTWDEGLCQDGDSREGGN